MRFFAGLAMLATAFTVQVETSTPAPPAPIVVVAEARAAAPAAVALESIVEPVAPSAPVTAAELIAATAVLLVAGFALRVRAERGPPTV
jgi:hypothetical protein